MPITLTGYESHDGMSEMVAVEVSDFADGSQVALVIDEADGMGGGVGPGRGAQVTEQTCDRCDKPMDPDDERECEECCQVLCSRCMYDDTLCNDCEAVQEEEAAFPEEFEP